MGQIELAKGKILHSAGKDTVETLEIVTKGSIKISNQYSHIVVKLGTILGTVEIPGEEYTYTYEAEEDSNVFSYPYNSPEDILKVLNEARKSK